MSDEIKKLRAQINRLERDLKANREADEKQSAEILENTRAAQKIAEATQQNDDVRRYEMAVIMARLDALDGGAVPDVSAIKRPETTKPGEIARTPGIEG